ncbi:MAG: Mu transposase C-terminal domain-containing protein [Lachnospiraceae bacterium]|nr:Mu transposase C-terminal domain-containing protein [Lachnospiraceae bacterium]
MSNISISIGNALLDIRTQNVYRVIYTGNGYIALCKINTSKIEIEYPTAKSVGLSLRNNLLEIVPDENIVFDENSIPEEYRKAYNEKKELVRLVVSEYGPTYMGLIGKKSKPVITDFISRSKFKKSQVWNIIRKYLQSGFKDSSLMDQRYYRKVSNEYTYKNKPGRKPKDITINKGKRITSEDIKNFEKYLKRFMSHEVKTIQNAYDDMCGDCYMESINDNGVYIEKLREDRPTYTQFYYYIRKNTTEQARKEAKKTAGVVHNDSRVHIGTVMDGIRGPAHKVEMDAQEMDVSIVSEEYPEICVGRPILYIMIDVFSQIILAFSIALDNNSVVGCTNCFFNLIEDKEELFRKYCQTSFSFNADYSINDIWPTGIRPAVIKMDRGSDFISDEVTRIACELNIDLEHVTPRSGSLKPLVENFFKNINTQLADLLSTKGLIRKVYNSKHHEQSCLDINDVRALVLNHIYYHNTHVLEQYQPSPDMKRKKLILTPANIWKYGCENFSNPMRLPSRDEFIYKVLTPEKATVSKLGIKYQGMRYFNAEDEILNELMFHQQLKEKTIDIRTDPRDMGHIYYLQKGKLETASLDPFDIRYREYYGMSKKHFIMLEKEYEQVKAISKEYNRQSRVGLRKTNMAIIEDKSENSTVKSDTKNLGKKRELEKARLSKELSVANRFALDKKSEETPEQKKTEKINENKQKLANIPQSKEDVIARMRSNSKAIFDDDDI